MFTLRQYQQDATDAGLDFFRTGKGNAIEVLPTGSGKSLVIAALADGLGEPLLIFQPSKEILEQNFAKLRGYGHCPAIFSASAGKKQIAPITFATIGSTIRKPELFKGFRHIVVDECHLINAKGGMYQQFIAALGAKVLGLTATPYRLTSDGYNGSMLKFLTRTRPRIFDRVVYVKQTGELFKEGYLAALEYFPIKTGVRHEELEVNSTGADYTERSLHAAYGRHHFNERVQNLCERFIKSDRKNMLVFTRFTREAQFVVDRVPGCAIVTAETPKPERERLLAEFKAGNIRVMLNVGILTTGFDYPELDTMMVARPTMSLALWYQMVGRAIRPHPSKKSAFILDLCGNYKRFGKVEDLLLEEHKGLWTVTSNGRRLTNIPFDEQLTVA